MTINPRFELAVSVMHTIFAIFTINTVCAVEIKNSETTSSSTSIDLAEDNKDRIFKLKVNVVHNNNPLELNVIAEGTSITALNRRGEKIWSITLPEEPVGPRRVRKMWLEDRKIRVIQGKHTYYWIDPISGNVSPLSRS